MRILFLFIDQLRHDFATSDDKLMSFLSSLGGTIYENCWTPTPNTTRAMACLTTGEPQTVNKCNTPIRTAGFYLPSHINTMFDDLSDKGYSSDVYYFPRELAAGVLPLQESVRYNKNRDLPGFCKGIAKEENQFVWLSTDIVHANMNTAGYTAENMMKGCQLSLDFIKNSIDLLDATSYDHVFIFSDHGCLLANDARNTATYMSNKRCQVFMFHHAKEDVGITKSSKFCSLLSLRPTVNELIGSQKTDFYDFSLFSEEQKEYYVFEDTVSYKPRAGNTNEMWCLKFNDCEVYLDRKSYSVYGDLKCSVDEAIKIICEESSMYINDDSSILTKDATAVSRYEHMSAQARKHFIRDEGVWW